MQSRSAASFFAHNPLTGQALEPPFFEAAVEDVDRSCREAERAFEAYSLWTASQRAGFLRAIAEEILNLGEALLERAHSETALPMGRLTSERGRTLHQIRMFAELIEEGSWVDARIDRAQPQRAGSPRPDIRRLLVPLGPVAVFGASNFPLAFSVAGGDTVSALAAGCPVVVKAHPAHPGTCELVACAIGRAAERCQVPKGVFSMLQGASNEVGQSLVSHPSIKAVGFTGSLRGGRALYDAAGRREEPIPVFAEMGSSNPVFVLPGALKTQGESIARSLAASVTLGSGQFCTNPGLTLVLRDEPANAFLESLAKMLGSAAAGTTVYAGIRAAFDADMARIEALPGVAVKARSNAPKPNPETAVQPALLEANAETFLANASLANELYGPATLAVTCDSKAELLAIARSLHGQLTATVFGTPQDLAEFGELVEVLKRKAGRLVFNGVPTGVEVCSAMHHGGPYPATTDSRATSVGTAAIERWVRPVAFQDFPDAALPDELKDANPRGIWRLVDGVRTRDPI